MDMKPFNCHEAGDGDLYRRDEEGASLRGHLGLLDDAMAAVVAPRKLRLRKTWNCKYGKPRKKKRGGHTAASQACESPNPPFPRPGPCPCRQLQERGSARINASWGKEVINPAVSNKNRTFHAGDTQGSCPSDESGARIVFIRLAMRCSSYEGLWLQ